MIDERHKWFDERYRWLEEVISKPGERPIVTGKCHLYHMSKDGGWHPLCGIAQFTPGPTIYIGKLIPVYVDPCETCVEILELHQNG